MKKNYILFLSFLIIPLFSSKINNNIMNEIYKNILIGKFDPATHDDFVEIIYPYSKTKGMYIQKEVDDAFAKMYNSAKNDNVDLQIISATRNFYRQKRIWENKWQKIKSSDKNLSEVEIAIEILKYSSMPATSRHHWGTDIDINSLSPSYFKSGKGLKEYNWLVENAQKFGFCQPYKNKSTNQRTGYEDEAWHWSYFPISSKYTEYYIENINYEDIIGFLGYNTAKEIDVIKNYVLGISEDCKCKNNN